MVAAHDPTERGGPHGAANDNAPADGIPARLASPEMAADASPETHPADDPHVVRKLRQSARPPVRVFCDLPEGLAVTGAEVEIFETYLTQLIGGIIANDNEP